MGCNCGGSYVQQYTWTITAPAGKTFPGGATTKEVHTQAEAAAILASMPGAEAKKQPR